MDFFIHEARRLSERALSVLKRETANSGFATKSHPESSNFRWHSCQIGSAGNNHHRIHAGSLHGSNSYIRSDPGNNHQSRNLHPGKHKSPDSCNPNHLPGLPDQPGTLLHTRCSRLVAANSPHIGLPRSSCHHESNDNSEPYRNTDHGNNHSCGRFGAESVVDADALNTAVEIEIALDAGVVAMPPRVAGPIFAVGPGVGDIVKAVVAAAQSVAAAVPAGCVGLAHAVAVAHVAVRAVATLLVFVAPPAVSTVPVVVLAVSVVFQSPAVVVCAAAARVALARFFVAERAGCHAVVEALVAAAHAVASAAAHVAAVIVPAAERAVVHAAEALVVAARAVAPAAAVLAPVVAAAAVAAERAVVRVAAVVHFAVVFAVVRAVGHRV